ncbi:hypothetical protein FVE85_4210 [Porphyridium purpureum]|uniref:PWWP domain-containing protein n=1 Tax=Porphyridium purpureum TaxID=35688 RepID=A0A5J4YSM5_PORPP|nr:hypothetical protein FVE85_4210 [Porphyridium purpureum]|eukprot:POR1504..scf229_5
MKTPVLVETASEPMRKTNNARGSKRKRTGVEPGVEPVGPRAVPSHLARAAQMQREHDGAKSIDIADIRHLHDLGRASDGMAVSDDDGVVHRLLRVLMFATDVIEDRARIKELEMRVAALSRKVTILETRIHGSVAVDSLDVRDIETPKSVIGDVSLAQFTRAAPISDAVAGNIRDIYTRRCGIAKTWLRSIAPHDRPYPYELVLARYAGWPWWPAVVVLSIDGLGPEVLMKGCVRDTSEEGRKKADEDVMTLRKGCIVVRFLGKSAASFVWVLMEHTHMKHDFTLVDGTPKGRTKPSKELASAYAMAKQYADIRLNGAKTR